MPVKQLPLDLARERLPQLLHDGIAHIRKLPLPRPNWPLGQAAARWISWRTVVGALLLGGIVHIIATFVAPAITAHHAFQALEEKLPANRMVVLPPPAPGRQIVPELPPDTLYAMCRYDLSAGPVSVAATVLGPGWALSVHTPQGDNFYVLPGLPSRRTDVSFVIVPGSPDAQQLPHRESSSADSQIASPTQQGLVILRAPVRGLAWAAETDAIVQRATCTQVKP